MAVSVDSVDKARAMKEKTKINALVLSDPAGQMLDYFKLWNEKRPIAKPASFLINSQGDVVWKLIAPSYKIRPKPEHIIETARKIIGAKSAH